MARYELCSYMVTFCLIQGPYVLFLRTYFIINEMCFTSSNQQLAMALLVTIANVPQQILREAKYINLSLHFLEQAWP
jgi:hypothetical protein